MAAVEICAQTKESNGVSAQHLPSLMQSGNDLLNGLKSLLERLAKSEAGSKNIGPPRGNADDTITTKKAVEIARKMYKLRRQRNNIFGNNNLFGEPAWDILLDLFIAGENGTRTSVTAACIGAYVPPTTALRWLKELEKEGLLVREVDMRDGRRTFVCLSPKANELMLAYFQCFK